MALPPDPAPPAKRSRNPFFPLVAMTSVAFIVTILALVSTVFGDPQAPVAKWLDKNGGRLIGGEILVFVIVSVAALVVDRRQTLREKRETPAEASSTPASQDKPQ